MNKLKPQNLKPFRSIQLYSCQTNRGSRLKYISHQRLPAVFEENHNPIFLITSD